jgi:hypothetical protein
MRKVVSTLIGLCLLLAPVLEATSGELTMGGKIPDSPPLNPTPDEVAVQPFSPIPSSCLDEVNVFKRIEVARTGAPYFTHSKKFGDIVRFDIFGRLGGNETITRIVCTSRGQSVVGPGGTTMRLPTRP